MPLPLSCGVSMGLRSEPRGVAPAGGKKQDPAEPEDHALGRSRGGYGTKLHILCDGHGVPLHFHLTPGQLHDSKAFDVLLEAADRVLVDEDRVAMPWPVSLAGDKG